MELIPGLPDEIGLECLIRLPYTCHQAAKGVCRRWKEVINGRDFSKLRKQSGHSHLLACMVQSWPEKDPADGRKPIELPNYGVTVFDQRHGKWDRLPSIPKYPDGLPLFCQLAAAEGVLVVMGGWDPTSWDPVRDVFVYDFTRGQWRQGKDMPVARSFFAADAVDGRVFVAGGHDENKSALRSASVYDVRSDEWSVIADMGEERDECEGVVIGGDFWVVSGYTTERQGSFGNSAEVYELATGRWRRVDSAWAAEQCPRACVGPARGERLVCWPEEEKAVRVGTCAVDLGERALLAGSPCPGAPHGFFLVEVRDGQIGKLERIDVPECYGGFVQSGCCVEI